MKVKLSMYLNILRTIKSAVNIGYSVERTDASEEIEKRKKKDEMNRTEKNYFSAGDGRVRRK
jgi:hypothetical protein